MECNTIIDLTLPFREPMRGFRMKEAKNLEKDGWNASDLEIYSHAGTHMDAPLHFGISDVSIDRIPLQKLICDCHIIHISDPQPSQILGPELLDPVLKDIRHGHGIVLRTGWSRFVNEPAIYRDKLPRIGEDLARRLAGLEISMLGVEPPSVADVNNIEELQRIHRILLEAGIIIIEGLCNLERLRSPFARVMAFPLKIEGGDGAPARVLATEF